MDFGSDAIVSEQSDKHVGISACSSLITSDGHHFVHWRIEQHNKNGRYEIVWLLCKRVYGDNTVRYRYTVLRYNLCVFLYFYPFEN